MLGQKFCQGQMPSSWLGALGWLALAKNYLLLLPKPVEQSLLCQPRPLLPSWKTAGLPKQNILGGSQFQGGVGPG